jgi:hypothetical protein
VREFYAVRVFVSNLSSFTDVDIDEKSKKKKTKQMLLLASHSDVCQTVTIHQQHILVTLLAALQTGCDPISVLMQFSPAI